MKTVRILLTATALFLLRNLAQGQGIFQNLNFESASVPSLPSGQLGGSVSSLDGVPRWTVYIGPNEVSEVGHNQVSLGSAAVSILGPVWNDRRGAIIIDGNYSASLQAGISDVVGGLVSVSIAQQGTIPADAQSIRIKIDPYEGNPLQVSLGSQVIPMITLGTDSKGVFIGGDISSFAGKLEELRLTALELPQNPFGSVVVDDILFSSQPIPEPGTVALIITGGVVLAWLGIRRRGED